MKPSKIFDVLDLAVKIGKNGKRFNPLFTGDAGVGKSEICQAWAKSRGYKLLDIRPAYLEGPDFIGLPFVIKNSEDNVERTVYALPDFWPTSGQWLVLIEEPNRANNSTLNCLMQFLTDRKVGNYDANNSDKLEIVVASCINPDNAMYNVNSMDTALRNRFEEFDVRYDFNEFVEFMEKENWHKNPIQFIKSGTWIYKSPEEIANDKEGHYVSPRTWSKMNNAESVGLADNQELHREASIGILGKAIGTMYNKFIFEITPVQAKDLVEDKEKAFEKLKGYASKSTYRGDLIDVTVESVIKEFGKLEGLTEQLVIDTVMTIPMDQGNNLLMKMFMDGHIPTPKELVTKYPMLKEHIKYALKRQENATELKVEPKEEVKKAKKKK